MYHKIRLQIELGESWLLMNDYEIPLDCVKYLLGFLFHPPQTYA